MLAGALAGLLAGGGAAWLVAADPGRGRGGPGTVRGDLDVIDAGVRAIDERLALAEARWRRLEERVAAQAPAPAGASEEQVRAIVDDLRALRDATQAEFRRVSDRLEDLRRRLDDASSPPPEPSGPPTAEEEDRWATLARDPDGGRRFSALQRLGRFRSERSVQVSVDSLADEDPKVVWQAVRNLGRFRAREAAAAVARLLDGTVEIRAAAYEALLDMGAPTDTGFDATALPDDRKDAVAALRRWAETEER